MIETLSLTTVGGVAVSFLLTFFRALRRDARKPRIQLVRKRVIKPSVSVSNENSPAAFRHAA